MKYIKSLISLFFSYSLFLLFFTEFPLTDFSNTYADEVILVNGDHFSGKLISVSQETIRLSTLHSGIVETDFKYLQQLDTDNPMIVILKSGERIIGPVAPGDGKSIVVHSLTLGKCILSFTNIESIEPSLLTHKTDQNKDNILSNLQDIRGRGSETFESSESTDSKPAVSATQSKPIGTRPDEEDIRRIFLRQSSILLENLEIETEVSLDYLGSQLPATIFNARFRQFQIPFSFRIGILNRMEGYIHLPLLYTKQEISFAEESVSQRSTGIGDMSMGINWQILGETSKWPDIIAGFKIRIPTGGTPGEQGLSEGSGHWAESFSIQFIKTADPVVLFWGLGYTHDFSATHFINDGTYNVQPGDTLDYNFGFGFAVNHKISLSEQVLGEYQWETRADGWEIPGSSSEPLSLRSALTYRLSRKSFIEPFLTIGLNDDSPDFTIGIAATRRFGK